MREAAARRARAPITDIAAFIRENLTLAPVPGLPAIRLYTAHERSGLRRLAADNEAPAPYWAYVWPGGASLARYVRDNPQVVAGRRVLDLGSGGGIVAIAAAQRDARSVVASERDPGGRVALALNASANAVTLDIIDELTGDAPADVDIVLAGDVFYAPDIAARTLKILDRCASAGIDVLVGDPGRPDLPRHRLELIAEYAVAEVGVARDRLDAPGLVFSLRP